MSAPYLGDGYEPSLPVNYEVDLPERRVRRLYASDGTVLATISDRPPTGFHQGQRGYKPGHEQ